MESNDSLGIIGGLVVFLFVVLIFLSPFLLLIFGGLIGAARERRHFEELAEREKALGGFLLTDLKTPPPGMAVANTALVSGSVVIAADHFKNFCAQWRKVFGGEFRALGKMQERARREAILRMVDEARQLGATSVCNIRVETSTIGSRQEGRVAGCELLAYGTALVPAAPGASTPDASATSMSTPGAVPPPIPGSPR